MTEHMKIKIEDCMGIPLEECFMCGNTENITRHHVIPLAMKPKRNITIPLCAEHKDVLHPIVKQFYFPKKLRNKLSKAKKHSEDVLHIIESLQTNLQFHSKNTTSLSIPPMDK